MDIETKEHCGNIVKIPTLIK